MLTFDIKVKNVTLVFTVALKIKNRHLKKDKKKLSENSQHESYLISHFITNVKNFFCLTLRILKFSPM
jgi:hypothetical protein